MTEIEQRLLKGLTEIYKRLDAIEKHLGLAKGTETGTTANGKKEYTKVPVDTTKSVVRGMGRYKDHSYPVLHIPEHGGPLLALHDGTNQFRAKKELVSITRWQRDVPWDKAVEAKFDEVRLFGIETRE